LTVSPVKDSSGKIIGASKIARDITIQKRYERQQKALYGLVAAVNRASDLPEICKAAVEAVREAQGADRAAILLFDNDNVMRFKASAGLSEEYRRAVEGHSPWEAGDANPQPLLIDDMAKAPLEEPLREIVLKEGIRAVGFIPLMHQGKLLGKFMIYHNTPHRFSLEEVRPAQTIGSQVVFAIERQRTGEALEELVNERTKSLREAMAQMEEFSYTVSHDLRGPLRRMQYYSETLLQDFAALLPEEAGFSLRRIATNAKRLDQMVLDVLTFSQMAREELRIEQVAVEKLVREIVEQYPGMQPPQAEIEIKPLPDAMGHEALLTQVFSNLLANAIKFVPPGVPPKVSVWSQCRDGQVRFWIADNGIGIDPKFQHRLFNLFERIDPAANYEGTGVGLAIVRKAVERMGGKAGVESDGKNGSRFWFEIRAAEQPGGNA
jgi:signal transduction histidine kinase